jgi:hypothetical protein
MTEEVKTILECSDCGAEIAENDERLVTHDGKTICESCMCDYSMCEDSDEYFHNDDLTEVYYLNSRGHKLSKLVYDLDNYLVCSHDNCYWDVEDTEEVRTGRGNRTDTIAVYYIHNSDVDTFTCDDCGERFFTEDNYNSIGDGDRTICNHCYESGEYIYCEEHGMSVHVDDCSCHGEEDDKTIKKYDYKPSPEFQGNGSKIAPYMGFELEIENKSNKNTETMAENFLEFLGNKKDLFYLKDDGSLSNGFEIVSHPMTLQSHREINYKEILNHLSSEGFRSHDTSTCGLHVHISKRWMDDGHKTRLGQFFVLYRSMLERLARRSESQWCRFVDKNLKDKASLISSREKYEAINWKNRETVEIRIFKGTLKPETFTASIELVQAIYSFTQNKHCFCTDIKSKKNLVKRFTNFVNKNDFPALSKYMAEKLVFIVDESEESEEVA